MKERLLNSINKSFDWLIENLEFFNIQDYNLNKCEGITDERKSFGELALALLIIQKSPEFVNDPRVEKIKKYVKQITESKNFVFNMQKDVTLFAFYLTVYVSLKEVGIELPNYERILKNQLKHNFVSRVERTAWQQIDLKYFLDKAGFENQLPDNKSLYKASSLNFLPNLIFNRTIDSYAITHLLFFLSDFGSRDISSFLGEKLQETKNYVATLTKLYTHKRDWDLLGELLISCHILKHRDFSLHKKCLHLYLDSQCEEGDFISRNALEAFDNHKKLSQKERFKANHHPTLVGLFCCVLEYQHIITKDYEHANVEA